MLLYSMAVRGFPLGNCLVEWRYVYLVIPFPISKLVFWQFLLVNWIHVCCDPRRSRVVFGPSCLRRSVRLEPANISLRRTPVL